MKRIISSFLLVILFSCSKKKEPSVQETRTDLLINKKWHMVSFKQKKADGAFVDVDPRPLPAYLQDNYYSFNKDSSYTFNDGPVKQPDITREFLDQGTWMFKQNGEYLLMVSLSQGSGWDLKVIDLTATDLSVEFTEADKIFAQQYHILE